ncbi:MAG: BspA family leucine-rich repeat surface protein [Bacteroidales bacterium]
MKKSFILTFLFFCILSLNIKGENKEDQKPFITKWQTNISNPNSCTIKILTHPDYDYAFDVDWENDGVYDEFSVQGDIQHTYAKSGVYSVSIKGKFPAIYFNSQQEGQKIIDITQWGDIQWKTFEHAFESCFNLKSSAQDTPNLNEVESFASAFAGATVFTGDLRSWNVSKAKNMSSMFHGASTFKCDLNQWDVSNVEDMSSMFFSASSFDKGISKWDVSSLKKSSNMFRYAISFNDCINSWNVSKLENMAGMFYGTDNFNQDLNLWDVRNVTNMAASFARAYIFDGDISSWDVSNVDNMEYMFWYCKKFNGNLSKWNVGKVEDMKGMFGRAEKFRSKLYNWDVSNVKDMSFMFCYAIEFNQDISSWNVSNVNSMGSMFYGARKFNIDISSWNMSNVTRTDQMFWRATSFAQDLSNWNVSNVISMSGMFLAAEAFNGNISKWNICKVQDMNNMFKESKIPTERYNEVLIKWSKLELQKNVKFDTGNSQYSSKEANGAKQNIIDKFGWKINDAGRITSSFIVEDLLKEQLIGNTFSNSGSFCFEIKGMDSNTNTSFKVFDLNGHCLIYKNCKQTCQFDLSAEHEGMYIVVLTNGNKSYKTKVIYRR